MKLIDWIKAQNITQTDFARAIGSNQATISRVCRERPRWPDRQLMQKIQEHTGGAVTPADFLYLPDQQPPQPGEPAP